MDALDRASLQVETELVVLFRKVRAISERFAEQLHPGLDSAAYGLLARVDSGHATTVSALAAVQGVGKPTISRQVTALEEDGLVQRVPGLGERSVQLVLTPLGVERFTAAQAARRSALRDLLSAWPLGDVEELGRLLGQFNALT